MLGRRLNAGLSGIRKQSSSCLWLAEGRAENERERERELTNSQQDLGTDNSGVVTRPRPSTEADEETVGNQEEHSSKDNEWFQPTHFE